MLTCDRLPSRVRRLRRGYPQLEAERCFVRRWRLLATAGQKTFEAMRQQLRPYHYLTVPRNDGENPHLVREMVKCGRPSCRCARDPSAQHGPYWYLRWEQFDRQTQQVRY